MEKTREEAIKDIAAAHDVSVGTVATLLNGLETTGGNQVQFSIPELGGMGQWQPGMVMVGDMFNSSLKHKVDRLCTELSALSRSLAKEDAPSATATGSGSSATFKGSQNNSHYAYHASDKRLVIENGGKTTLYDTTGYPLTGVQQSQDGSGKHLSFTYPGGSVKVDELKEIKAAGEPDKTTNPKPTKAR